MSIEGAPFRWNHDLREDLPLGRLNVIGIETRIFDSLPITVDHSSTVDIDSLRVGIKYHLVIEDERRSTFSLLSDRLSSYNDNNKKCQLTEVFRESNSQVPASSPLVLKRKNSEENAAPQVKVEVPEAPVGKAGWGSVDWSRE